MSWADLFIHGKYLYLNKNVCRLFQSLTCICCDFFSSKNQPDITQSMLYTRYFTLPWNNFKDNKYYYFYDSNVFIEKIIVYAVVNCCVHNI